MRILNPALLLLIATPFFAASLISVRAGTSGVGAAYRCKLGKKLSDLAAPTLVHANGLEC